MKSKLKALVILVIGHSNWHMLFREFQNLTNGFKRTCYSQEGEDLILERFFHNKTDGFFVDIGAHHPKRFSNTYLFYLKGWKGINVDAAPGSMKSFEKMRGRDINLEFGIADKVGEIDFYVFDEPALNSFDRELSLQREKETEYKIVKIQKVAILPLEQVLTEYLNKNQKIDFLSVDVEGLDEVVLKSNNWTLYRPQIVLIELYEWDITHPTHIYMESVGYSFFAKTLNSVFYKKIE